MMRRNNMHGQRRAIQLESRERMDSSAGQQGDMKEIKNVRKKIWKIQSLSVGVPAKACPPTFAKSIKTCSRTVFCTASILR
jgi:hypothetical protein